MIDSDQAIWRDGAHTWRTVGADVSQGDFWRSYHFSADVDASTSCQRSSIPTLVQAVLGHF